MPPPAPAPSEHRIRSFLGWAFLISIGVHLIFGPFLGRYKPYTEQDKEVEKVSVTKKIKVVVPTPPPKPTPPPTPPPKSTPPPIKQTAPPETKKLKLNVVHTTNKSAGANENAYVAPPVGDENGNPNGNSNKGPAQPAPAGTPGTPAPPTPTPKPACANPHVDATVTHAVEPEFPELARQQGAIGVTQVQVTLTETGAVSDAKVYKSSGNASLDRSAIAAAKESTYAPEVDNCVKQAGTYLFRAEFDAQ